MSKKAEKDYTEKKYSDIVSIDESGIGFKDGYKVDFTDCIRNNGFLSGNSNCVAERDVTAVPPYAEFYTSAKRTRIVFSKKGIFGKNKNEEDFAELKSRIEKCGFTTFDLN